VKKRQTSKVSSKRRGRSSGQGRGCSSPSAGGCWAIDCLEFCCSEQRPAPMTEYSPLASELFLLFIYSSRPKYLFQCKPQLFSAFLLYSRTLAICLTRQQPELNRTSLPRSSRVSKFQSVPASPAGSELVCRCRAARNCLVLKDPATHHPLAAPHFSLSPRPTQPAKPTTSSSLAEHRSSLVGSHQSNNRSPSRRLPPTSPVPFLPPQTSLFDITRPHTFIPPHIHITRQSQWPPRIP
jgi:hypothetical protein